MYIHLLWILEGNIGVSVDNDLYIKYVNAFYRSYV